MNNNYTPGLWQVNHSKSKTAFNVIGTVLGGRYKIARCPYPTTKGKYPQTDKREKEEAEANARLIAAAPELLEACQEMVKHLEETDFDVCGTPEKFMNKWKAAIAKAEGKKEQAI